MISIIFITVVQTKQVNARKSTAMSGIPAGFVRTEVFEIEKFDVLFCNVSLVHNCTFVDLEHSDFQCIQNGSGFATFTDNKILDSATGIRFTINFSANLKSDPSSSEPLVFSLNSAGIVRRADRPDPCDIIETTTIAVTMSTVMPSNPPFHPVPGECLTKDNTPVDVDEQWEASCKDDEGNSYVEGSSLLSCCGCFKYMCIQEDGYLPPRYSWTKEVSPLCCQTCNGTVVPGGTVVDVVEIGDKCGTVKTLVCKLRNRGKVNEQSRADSVRDGNKLELLKKEQVVSAAIEDEYHYENCCPDENGLHNFNWTVPDPATCSSRRCESQEGWIHAAWVTTQLYPGCGCCLVEGDMVPDGYSWTVGTYPRETWECCRGKVVMLKEPVKG